MVFHRKPTSLSPPVPHTHTPPLIFSKNSSSGRVNILGLTAVESVKDAAIHKKMFGSSFATLMICNDEMNDLNEK